MRELLRIYDGAIPEELLQRCEALMASIEPYHVNEPGLLFDNLFVQQHDTALANALAEVTWEIAYRYRSDLPVSAWIPEPEITGFSLKRYPPGGVFGSHIDTQSPESTGRQLAFIYYFDSDAGTRFLWDDPEVVEARRGRCCVFPPMWMFPHEGMPVTTSKMCLTTYLYNNAEVGQPWPPGGNKAHATERP